MNQSTFHKLTTKQEIVMTYPRTFSHIGLSITDLEKAVEFYTKVLGWYVIMPATEIVSDDSAIGVMC